MTALEILKQARKNLARGWCQGSFGQDARGLRLDAVDIRHATKVCIKGAILKTSAIGPAKEESLAMMLVVEQCRLKDPRYDTIAGFNDSEDRTQEECLEVFDAAIRELEEQ